ncbi:Protein CBG19589 [Caenorhabditis briggsae]|uniref:Uncharacterized protein n=2 Tax=Caenorhabditis briggsae TaxID=6238 RepID=A0AAE9EFM0_CAEBR|nr:Protein CBG19589 [Caenorhabditis briggsae]ULU07859.1 hypothetical protein L3Y34_019114 [Caenorhabditis briggsae]UMM19792.1 hypothetical protein L5515_015244 [Caenorhabditis briggsae]CAP36807.1 Protein CBG19589 [Caenorhabditis briggsae]
MSSVTSTSSAYSFKYFPRCGQWTKEMQMELDEHSRQMAKLMIHVQGLYQNKKQLKKDQQREDTDADCMIHPESPISTQSSSSEASSVSTSPQPGIQNHFYQEELHQQFQLMPIDQFNLPANYTVHFQPIQYTAEGYERNGCTYFHY